MKRHSSLTAREKATYDRTTNLIADLRRGEGSYTELLRKHHLGSGTARKYAGRDLLGGTRGKPVRASKADRRVRDLRFPQSSGDVRIRTRSSRDATYAVRVLQRSRQVSARQGKAPRLSRPSGAARALRVRKLSPIQRRFLKEPMQTI